MRAFIQRKHVGPNNTWGTHDDLALVHTTKTEVTYKHYFVEILKAAIPPKNCNPVLREIVNNRCFKVSIKEMKVKYHYEEM